MKDCKYLKFNAHVDAHAHAHAHSESMREKAIAFFLIMIIVLDNKVSCITIAQNQLPNYHRF